MASLWLHPLVGSLPGAFPAFMPISGATGQFWSPPGAGEAKEATKRPSGGVAGTGAGFTSAGPAVSEVYDPVFFGGGWKGRALDTKGGLHGIRRTGVDN